MSPEGHTSLTVWHEAFKELSTKDKLMLNDLRDKNRAHILNEAITLVKDHQAEGKISNSSWVDELVNGLKKAIRCGEAIIQCDAVLLALSWVAFKDLFGVVFIISYDDNSAFGKKPSGGQRTIDSLYATAELFHAAYCSQPNFGQKLHTMSTTLNFNQKNCHGQTTLQVAIFNDQFHFVQALLREQVDLETQDNQGQTAIFAAVRSDNSPNCDHHDYVRILLEHGALLDVTYNYCNSPLKLAEFNRKYEIVDMLQQALEQQRPSTSSDTEKIKVNMVAKPPGFNIIKLD
ncbi:ankyrin repeat domain-containing protein [Aspergillus stella-maris]|uniref:ankyrin repeat domain-containing protein n=1 Tax=Aspergillus stella-maris TaxID=1810926 RepID=UPI003CCCB1DD